MKDRCSDCGRTFSRVGNHWSQSDCSYHGLSSKQKEVITGILMGDGHINRGGKNPYLSVEMKSPNYLEYVSSMFPWISTGIIDREDGIYRFDTRSVCALTEFAEWYSSGKKIFPENIDLTPIVLKHWYVCDGGLGGNGPYPMIAVTNEIDNKQKIECYFDSIGIDIRWKTHKLAVRAHDVDSFFDYIGEPLPGFRYKWP